MQANRAKDPYYELHLKVANDNEAGPSSAGRSSILLRSNHSNDNEAGPSSAEGAQDTQSEQGFFKKYIFNWDAKANFTRKTFDQAHANLVKEMFNPEKANYIFGGNVIAQLLSIRGEYYELGLQHLYYHMHKIPAAKGALDVVGKVLSIPIDAVHSGAKQGAPLVLTPEQMEAISKEWQNLPGGIKFQLQNIGDGAILFGAGKIGKVGAKGFKQLSAEIEIVESLAKIEAEKVGKLSKKPAATQKTGNNVTKDVSSSNKPEVKAKPPEVPGSELPGSSVDTKLFSKPDAPLTTIKLEDGSKLPVFSSNSGSVGKWKNFVNKANPNAVGDHIVANVGVDGTVKNYAVYKPNPRNPSGFDLVKRVDLSGKEHYNNVLNIDIPTPHVAAKKIPGGIRGATLEEENIAKIIKKSMKNDK